MSSELEDLCQTLRAVAQSEILPRFQHTAARLKKDGSLVTAADVGTQALILAELKSRYPSMPVLSEEMTSEEQEALLAGTHGDFWCLDPLDGTSNFAGGFPFFGISLALFKGGQARLGLVLDPVRDECFSAERGMGACLNGQSLRLTPTCDALRVQPSQGGLGAYQSLLGSQAKPMGSLNRISIGAFAFEVHESQAVLGNIHSRFGGSLHEAICQTLVLVHP